jgi:hypothetical protein
LQSQKGMRAPAAKQGAASSKPRDEFRPAIRSITRGERILYSDGERIAVLGLEEGDAGSRQIASISSGLGRRANIQEIVSRFVS